MLQVPRFVKAKRRTTQVIRSDILISLKRQVTGDEQQYYEVLSALKRSWESCFLGRHDQPGADTVPVEQMT